MSVNFSSVTALEDIKPKKSFRNKMLTRSISTKKFSVNIIDENYSTLQQTQPTQTEENNELIHVDRTNNQPKQKKKTIKRQLKQVKSISEFDFKFFQKETKISQYSNVPLNEILQPNVGIQSLQTQLQLDRYASEQSFTAAYSSIQQDQLFSKFKFKGLKYSDKQKEQKLQLAQSQENIKNNLMSEGSDQIDKIKLKKSIELQGKFQSLSKETSFFDLQQSLSRQNQSTYQNSKDCENPSITLHDEYSHLQSQKENQSIIFRQESFQPEESMMNASISLGYQQTQESYKQLNTENIIIHQNKEKQSKLKDFKKQEKFIYGQRPPNKMTLSYDPSYSELYQNVGSSKLIKILEENKIQNKKHTDKANQPAHYYGSLLPENPLKSKYITQRRSVFAQSEIIKKLPFSMPKTQNSISPHKVGQGNHYHMVSMHKQLNQRRKLIEEAIENEFIQFNDMKKVQDIIEAKAAIQKDKIKQNQKDKANKIFIKRKEQLKGILKERQEMQIVFDGKVMYKPDMKAQLEDYYTEFEEEESEKTSEYSDDSEQSLVSPIKNLLEKAKEKKKKQSLEELEALDREEKKKFQEEIRKIGSINQLEGSFIEGIKNCSICQRTVPAKHSHIFRKDKVIFQKIAELKDQYRDPPVKPEDLSDDILSFEIKVKPPEQIIQEQLEDGMTLEEKAEKIEKEEHEKWKQWMDQVAKNLIKWKRQKWLSGQPNFYLGWDKAKENHLQDYLLEFEIRTIKEQQVLESIYKPSQDVIELRKLVSYLLVDGNIEQKEFFQNLCLARSILDRQKIYFDEISDLFFLSRKQTYQHKLHNELLEVSIPDYDGTEAVFKTATYEQRVLDEVVRKKKLNDARQQEVKLMTSGVNKEHTENIEIEFAKASADNQSFPYIQLIQPPEIIHQRFTLRKQVLNQNLCETLAQTLPMVQQNISEICFIDDYTNGGSLGTILNGMSLHQKSQLNVILFNGLNEIDQKTVDAICNDHIKPVDEELKSHKLKELSIIGSKFQKPQFLNQLLTTIQQNNKLQTLTLSNIGLSGQNLQILCDLIERKPSYLENIDISWNNFSSQEYEKVFNAIRHNYHIKYLNLAYNPCQKTDKLISLGNFVRQNPHLQHIDLSGVLQNSTQVRRIIKKLKKSQAIVVCHLSSIPAITDDKSLQKYIYCKLGILELNQHKIKPTAIEEDTFEDDLKARNGQIDWKQQYELAQLAQVQKRDILHNKSKYLEQPQMIATQAKLVIQRTLGNPEIEKNKKWTFGQECFSCQCWNYTMFWCESDVVPTLTGTFSLLYAPQVNEIQMIDVRKIAMDFLNITSDLEDNFTQFFNLLSPAEQFLTPGEKNELKKRFQEKDLTLMQMNDMWFNILIQELPKKALQILPQRPQFDLDQFYKNIREQRSETHPQLYFYADYMRPIQKLENFQIKANGKEIKKEFFVSIVREGHIPFVQLGKYTKEKKILQFDKEKSVFKNWTKDNPNTLRSAFRKDIQNWRVSRMIKDTNDYNNVVELLEKNYERIKVIFTNIVSSTESYPQLGLVAFGEFVRSCKLIDPKFQNLVDGLIIGVKSNPKISGGLIRFEFLEMLVRLANLRYKDQTNQNQEEQGYTFTQATELIVLAIQQSYTPRPWQEFRDEYLWALNTDSVFKANQDQLEKLHKYCFPRANDKGNRICLEIITKSAVGLAEKETKFCYGMSKMTVIDEVNNFESYQSLKFVEFLEFIARIAHVKYLQEEETTLDEKIERILDDVFPIIGLKRSDKSGNVDDDNTSEDSYEEMPGDISLYKVNYI